MANDPTARLVEMLGEDAKLLLSDGPTKEVMAKAMEEVKEEQIKANIGKAKEKIVAVLTAQREIKAIDKEYQSRLKAAQKKLNKLLGPLQSLLTGKEPPPEESEKEEGGDGEGNGQ